MPAIQNVVLTDRSSPTPITHTFKPSGSKDGVVTLKTSSTDGVLLDQKKLTTSVRFVNGRLKSKQVIAVPIVVIETVNGVQKPRLVDTSYVTLTWDISESTTEQHRNDLQGFVQSANATTVAMIHGAVVKGEGYYGD